MSEHEHTEPEQDERADAVEDLDVPQEQAEDVAGGADDRLTESISLNRR
jgi:hypothetical protein